MTTKLASGHLQADPVQDHVRAVRCPPYAASGLSTSSTYGSPQFVSMRHHGASQQVAFDAETRSVSARIPRMAAAAQSRPTARSGRGRATAAFIS